jgi:hypothetical protein
VGRVGIEPRPADYEKSVVALQVRCLRREPQVKRERGLVLALPSAITLATSAGGGASCFGGVAVRAWSTPRGSRRPTPTAGSSEGTRQDAVDLPVGSWPLSAVGRCAAGIRTACSRGPAATAASPLAGK